MIHHGIKTGQSPLSLMILACSLFMRVPDPWEGLFEGNKGDTAGERLKWEADQAFFFSLLVQERRRRSLLFPESSTRGLYNLGDSSTISDNSHTTIAITISISSPLYLCNCIQAHPPLDPALREYTDLQGTGSTKLRFSAGTEYRD